MKYPLSEEQIISQFKTVLTVINSLKNEDRKTKLLQLFNDNEDKITLSPASTSPKFHAAFPGGLLLHTLNVCKFSLKMYDLWKSMGATINYEKDTLLFCALVHDLGKIGDMHNDYYIENESEWHVKTRQEYYKINNELIWMKTQDRSLWWLQKYNIELTELEYIAILVHDGVYDESNKAYYTQFDAERKFRTNMPYVLHQADEMAMRIEFETYK
jgi:hypothetical protein